MRSKSNSLEKARKEAVTDGLKRALKSFGAIFGNGMNDRSFMNYMSKLPKNSNFPPRPEDVVNDPTTLDLLKVSATGKGSNNTPNSRPTNTRRELIKSVEKTALDEPRPLESSAESNKENQSTSNAVTPNTSKDSAREERLRLANLKKQMFSGGNKPSGQKRKRDDEKTKSPEKSKAANVEAAKKTPSKNESTHFIADDDDIFSNMTQMEQSHNYTSVANKFRTGYRFSPRIASKKKMAKS